MCYTWSKNWWGSYSGIIDKKRVKLFDPRCSYLGNHLNWLVFKLFYNKSFRFSKEIESLQGSAVRVIVYLLLIVLIGLLVTIFIFTQWLEDRLTNKRYKNKWTVAVKRYILTLLHNIKILKDTKGESYKQFILSFAIWTLFAIKMVLLVHLFTRNYDPIFLTEITYISYMMSMIPLLPGGIGSFEATMTGLLMAMKIQPGEALAITILFRFITFWFVIIISLLYVFVWKIGERRDEIPKH